MADRVHKFVEDTEKVLRAESWSKVGSEAVKLRKWVHKHQNENVPDSAQAKLFELSHKLYKAGQEHEELEVSNNCGVWGEKLESMAAGGDCSFGGGSPQATGG